MMKVWQQVKNLLYRYVPTHVDNPFKLVGRMIRSRNRAARFALIVSALAIVCIPIDIVLSFFERKRLRAVGDAPPGNMIFVCGPARSGTTLVFQVLARHIPVSYVRNFTAIFPRSPTVVTSVVRRFSRDRESTDGFENYYGKTLGMHGPSEANHLWNRWVELDSNEWRTRLSRENARRCRQFFAAFSKLDHRPLLCKNNNMNVYAEQVAEAIPNSIFICLRRDPPYLAQSLLQARREIIGNVDRGYGVQDVTSSEDAVVDPIESVCAQVKFLNHRANVAQQAIGEERFWIIDYESFCENPGVLIDRVARYFGTTSNENCGSIEPLENRNIVTNPDQMEKIRRCLKNLEDFPESQQDEPKFG